MIAIALMIARKLAPFIALALILSGVWWHGFSSAEKNHIEQIAQIKADSNEVLKQSAIQNEHAKQTLIHSARIIDEANDAHQKQIADIAANNAQLLNDRLRRETASCNKNTSANNSTSTTISNENANADRIFLERAGERLIERHKLADEINESLIACQSYLDSVQSTIQSLEHE